MGTSTSLDSDWATIESLLPRSWREVAAPHGVVLDPSSEFGAKVHDLSVLLRMILHHACTGSSLQSTTALAAAVGLITISHVALHKWMKKCGGWIAAIVTEMVDASARFSAAAWAGYEVIAADATTVQRPGAKGVTARVHYAMRLADLRMIAIHVTNTHVGETLRNFVLRRNQLWLLDRGYCNANGIAHALRAGADVLLRFCIGPLPLCDKNGGAVDARALMRRCTRVNAVVEHTVSLEIDTGERIQGRLIITKLPKDKACKAERRLEKERGKKHVTPDAREQAHFVMLFTTVPESKLSATQLLTLYRLRWQIELSIKRDKSIAGLDRLPNFRDDTIETWICALMLGRILAEKLAAPGEPFPPSIVGHHALRPSAAALLRLRLDR